MAEEKAIPVPSPVESCIALLVSDTEVSYT
jgi:hypothetical protein